MNHYLHDPAAAINSWDIDDWLQSLGIDPDCDCTLSIIDKRAGSTYRLEVRVPGLEDAGKKWSDEHSAEYLVALEAAWRDRFGAKPVEFRASLIPPANSTVLRPEHT